MKALFCSVLVLLSATFCLSASANPDGTSAPHKAPHTPAPHRH